MADGPLPSRVGSTGGLSSILGWVVLVGSNRGRTGCLVELCLLGSRRRGSPRAKHSFGFSGMPELEVVQDEEEPVNDDDILESLTRRAQFSRQLGDSTEVALNLSEESRPEPLLPVSKLSEPGRRDYGKYVFALMLLGGMVVVLVVGAFRALLDTSLVGRATQSLVLTSVFTDPVKLLLVAVLCLIPAVLIRRSRRARDRLLFA